MGPPLQQFESVAARIERQAARPLALRRRALRDLAARVRAIESVGRADDRRAVAA